MPSRIAFKSTVFPACLLIAMAACAPDSPVPTSAAGIQGDARSSPLAGRRVSLSGAVTALFPGVPDAGLSPGFTLQDETPDGRAATSDGVFVMMSSLSARLGSGLETGQRVRVTGTVIEVDGETRIDASSVEETGTAAVSPTALTLPAANATSDDTGLPLADLEALEGMLVRVDAGLIVTDTYNLDRFGSVLLNEGGRAYAFTGRERPDVDGYRRHIEEIARRRLVLDDGRLDENVTPIRFLRPGFDNERRPLRIGDEVGELTGVLRFVRGSASAGDLTWRLMPTRAPTFVAVNPRPDPPPKMAGSLRVAGINALNFFATVDADIATCGPGALDCRGADSPAELARQQDKLITALVAMRADIIGLLEIENDEGRTLGLIADAMSARSKGAWSFIDTGTIGRDAIKVGLVFDPAEVRPVGGPAILDASIDPSFIDDRNRPVLAQRFEVSRGGGRFTVAVNHLKSKGSDCNDLGDPDRQDGQGNCNLTRTRAALAEIRWLTEGPDRMRDADVLVIGDLNAYSREDPVQAFTDAGYVNLVDRYASGPVYSFVFRGASGALDHALASPSLAEKVTGAWLWHSNADESTAIDYNLDFGRDSALFEPENPYRASDHDPVIVDLDANAL